VRQHPNNKSTIYRAWDVASLLPDTATWQITQDDPSGDQPSPVTGISNPTWSYTLTGLTNYVPYNIILNARIGSTPVLTGTVTVMPTDLRVYLPLVLGE